MFLIRAGQITVDRSNRSSDGQDAKSADAAAGFGTSVFGELAMLGVESRRTATVRALTICFAMEIPRAAYVKAIARHPADTVPLEAFAVQAIEKMEEDQEVSWPFLTNMPRRIVYMLRLYAGRNECL